MEHGYHGVGDGKRGVLRGEDFNEVSSSMASRKHGEVFEVTWF